MPRARSSPGAWPGPRRRGRAQPHKTPGVDAGTRPVKPRESSVVDDNNAGPPGIRMRDQASASCRARRQRVRWHPQPNGPAGRSHGDSRRVATSTYRPLLALLDEHIEGSNAEDVRYRLLQLPVMAQPGLASGSEATSSPPTWRGFRAQVDAPMRTPVLTLSGRSIKSERPIRRR